MHEDHERPGIELALRKEHIRGEEACEKKGKSGDLDSRSHL
jgi:hypothetical protein